MKVWEYGSGEGESRKREGWESRKPQREGDSDGAVRSLFAPAPLLPFLSTFIPSYFPTFIHRNGVSRTALSAAKSLTPCPCPGDAAFDPAPVLHVDPSAAPEQAPPPGRADRLWHRLEQATLVQRPLAFYRRYERFMPGVFFFGGVSWDALTLRRIDAWIDNVLLLSYLLLLGGMILVALLVESGRMTRPWVLKHRAWFPPAIQFFMGALFSAYVVYYFQSASLTSTSLFVLLLVALLVANEFIHRRVLNLYLLFALYYFVAFSFFVFFVPVVTKVMSYGMFVLSGLLSLGLVWAMLGFLRRHGVFEQKRQYAFALGLMVSLFGLLNLFYLKDWMPPVPMALRYGGVFHNVENRGATYDLTYVDPPWYRFWRKSDRTFEYTEGDRVFCFAAIFAPTKLTKGIYHEWRVYDEAQQAWKTTDRIGYRIVGGRDLGYRGYTFKRQVSPGRWRVDVRTEDGRTLGRVGFTVVPADTAEARTFTTRSYE